ncbi:MAG: cell surface protein SprA [candidate division Zixibacteria bacterium]|nr:cell surface protein SprA [candidate division Zixibacteria bacterium]
MLKIVKKFCRLIAAAILIGSVIAGWSIADAAVGEIDIIIKYNSRFVPSLKLPVFPGGLSQENEAIGLFRLNRIKRTWSIEIPADQDYVSLTLFAGDHILYNPFIMSRANYIRYRAKMTVQDAWIDDMANFSGTKGKANQSEGIEIPLNFVNIPKPVASIIGEGGPRINVTGSRRISFSGKSQWYDDLIQTGTFKQSKFPSLHMEQTSRFKIKGQIGSKITIEVDQDSNRDVDLANTLKLRYKGEEDEIIKSVEAGNTNLSLPNSQFIGFSQSVQGLFGIKATAQIGGIELTMITSQEKGTSEKSTFSAGAQSSADTIWDYSYLHNVYFYLGYEFTSLDSLIEVQLFRNGNIANGDPYGLACVDPHYGSGPNETGGVDTLFYVSGEDSLKDEYEQRYFKFIEPTDYDRYDLGRYIVLHQQLPEGEALAAYIKYAHRDVPDGPVVIREEGMVTSDTLVLKLIRAHDPGPTFTTWDLEWKNVYDLHSREITREGFKLEIYKGLGNIETDTSDQAGIPYVQLFGFDQYNNSNPTDATPDGIFDFNTATDLDALRGHLIFHQREPFADSTFLDDPNPSVYNFRYSDSEQRLSKKYYIYVKTATRGNTFSLNRTNIIEGSEVVQMNDGRILKRGVDYNIIYEIGQITFINQDALNAAADISIDFEYAPFFMPEKKSLFGLAAQYEINDKSFFSISGLYRKESTKDFRPRVGREPKRSMIWDSNIKLHFDPEFVTSAVDALPFIETDAPSVIEFSGEIAQSFPNPNLRNKAYIDDFEGTKEYTDMVMRRGIWTKSSPPANRLEENRRKVRWYNPYDSYTIRDIWPDKDVQQHQNRQDVLILEFPVDSTSGPDTSAWAGIMRPMYAGLSNQTRTKFIEIWYLPDQTALEHPTLYIDAGKISEDMDGDTKLDTEDANFNGVFEEDEDTGLDGWTDEQEADSVTHDPVYPDDPSGDNWYYSDQGDERYDYSKINGTEDNREDPDRLNRFDTEDINNNGSLDRTDAYFQYKIDLNENIYVEETTTTGWQLLRIPFQDSTDVEFFGLPEYGLINFIRLWTANLPANYKLRLASIELVGNKWQEMALPDPYWMNGIPIRPEFEVSVKNTQEHANSYESPPGIYGEYDRETGIQEKEQSLVLSYGSFYPGRALSTFWDLNPVQDYTLYNKLKMYVHGDETLDEDTPLNFFIRLGTDSLYNYYEFNTKLYPGWDDRNYVEIDFTELTALKSYLHSNHPDSFAYYDTTAGNYTVKGNPSLYQVRLFVLGVEYDSLAIDTTGWDGDNPITDTTEVEDIPVNGEVWCDELVLTDVRRKSDFAGRFMAQVGLADLGSITFNFSRTGADFVKLSSPKPEGSLSTQQSLSGRFSLDKFVPPSWGLSLPISASWSKNQQLPRLKTGSDIVLPDEMREREKTESKSWSFNAKESFRRNTNNWLFNLTLNRIQTNYTYSKRYNSSPVNPINNSTTYDVSGKYDLTPRIKPSFMPLKWTKILFLPKSISEIQMFYLPTALKFDASVKSTRSFSKNNRDVVNSSYVRDFTGNQTYGLTLFSALKTDFSSTTRRDISNANELAFSFNPSEIKIGRERDYSQQFTTSFTPKISRLLSPRLQFQSRYSDNSDLAANPDSTRATRLSGNLRGDITLDVFKLLGVDKLIGSPKQENKFIRPEPKDKKPARDEISEEEIGEEEIGEEEIGEDEIGEEEIGEQNGDEEVGEGEPDQEGDADEVGDDKEPGGGFKVPNPMVAVKRVLMVFNAIKPIKTTFSNDKQINRSGLYARPGWVYTLGFADQTSIRRKAQEGFAAQDQITRTFDYSFTSGVTPVRNLDINSSYKNRVSVSRGTNTPTKSKSVEFPRVDANLSGLEKLPLFKILMKTASLQSVYTQKIDENENPDTRELTSRATRKNLSPLLGLNLSFNRGIKATIRYDYNASKTEQLRETGSNNRIDHSLDRNIKVGISYSFTAPHGLKIPILGKLKFNSQLTSSLDVAKKFRKSWFIMAGEETDDANSVETSVDIKLTYRFSAKVTGGIRAYWMDSDNKFQKRKQHVRELEIWTELRF